MSADLLPAVDCQGLAGAWTLGTMRTGEFELLRRFSLPGGFGDDAIGENRHLITGDWEQQTGDEPTWEDPGVGVAYVHGTPPCSGFSNMNVSKGSNARGPNSPINACMRDLVRFGARVRGTDGKAGAEIISFESVQGAFNQGRSLMQSLRETAELISGQRYDLTHVKMSGSTVGAAQYRHRYYPVFHRVPFGVARPEPHHVATIGDAIGDLAGLELDPEDQPYGDWMPSAWAREQGLLRGDGRVDWHVPWGIDREHDRAIKLVRELEADWKPGEGLNQCIIRQEQPPKTLLESYPYDETNWRDPRGWHWPRRVRPDKPGYVLTGAGGSKYYHWSEPRFLTIREASRLMGYPDSWTWPAGTRIDVVNSWIGKCCPVQSGQWLSQQVADSLRDPAEAAYLGNGDTEEIGDRERLHNNTLDYRRWPVEVSGFVLGNDDAEG